MLKKRYLFSFLIASMILPAKDALAQVRTSMKLFSDSFISSAFEAAQKNNYQFVGAEIRSSQDSQDSLHMNVSGAIAVGEPLLNYLNISEFYFDSKINDEQSLSLGRKKLDWNLVDSRWNLGIWEPVFKWNPLLPESQGLTGLFWQVQKPSYTLTLFASPLFIPDQGPSYDIQGGKFVKSNPWFRSPPDSIHIFGETTQIEYTLQKPNEGQVVLHSSYGAKLAFGDTKNLFFQLSHIYKPSNQLALGYDGVLDIPKDRGAVDLQPQVFYHSLSGADLSFAFSRFKLGGSVLLDRPSQDKIFDAQWTHPVFENALLSTGFLEMDMRLITFYFQRLDISGGNVKEEGELANPNRRPLMTRYPFKQANEAGIKGHLAFAKFRSLDGKISYTQSDKNDFSLIRFNSTLKLSNLWSLSAEAQLIDAGPLTADNQNDIAQFVNNDRYMIGASYVF